MVAVWLWAIGKQFLLNEAESLEVLRNRVAVFSLDIPFYRTRKQIRKYCPRYHYLPGEGILDFSTDCASAQLEPGDLGKAPPPKRGRLCEECCFFAGIPEEQLPETTVSAAPRDLVRVV